MKTGGKITTFIDSIARDEKNDRFANFLKYVIVENGKPNINNLLWHIKAVIRHIPLRGRVLDVGCGFGLHSILLKESARDISRVVGIDIDKEKIEVFKKLIKQFKLKNCQAHVADAENLPFPDNSFDCIYCNESLSHVKNIKRALSEAYRVLKNRGRIIVSDTEKWNPYALWFVYGKGHSGEHYLHQGEMKKLLSEQGFQDIKRVKGIVAPRNPLREIAVYLWPIIKYIDPKYILVGGKL